MRLMGLSAHPACPTNVSDPNNGLWWKIIYHADPFTKFTIPAPAAHLDDDRGERKRFAGAADGILGAMNDHQSMQQHYMVEHLVGMANNSSIVYSMPLSEKTFHT